jgi:hypothetical protein
MARVMTSAIVSDVRGKVGGSVFQRSAQGLSLRTHTTPVNTRTASQMSNRSMLYQLQVAWMALSADARLSWDAWSQYQNLSTGYFSTSKMTGQQAYIQLNRYRLMLGLARLDAPVFTPYDLPLFSITLSANDGNLTIDFVGMTDHTAYYPIIRFSSIIPPSRNNTSVPLRFVAGSWAATQIWAFGVNYITVFGHTPVTGERLILETGVLQTSNSTLSVFTKQAYQLPA